MHRAPRTLDQSFPTAWRYTHDPFSGAKVMKIKVGPMYVNYAIEGEGPWVVRSHSLACAISMWDEQAEALKRKYKVLRFDTRGHGASDAPAGAYTQKMLADDLHGLLGALHIDSPH